MISKAINAKLETLSKNSNYSQSQIIEVALKKFDGYFKTTSIEDIEQITKLDKKELLKILTNER